MSDAGSPAETTDQVGERRSSPRDLIARGLLTLALVGLIVWLLLSNVGELSAVVDALENVSLADAILLVALTLLSQVLIGAQLAATVPGLGLGRAMVAVESAAAASNVPGPSGTATRLAVLRSWGFYTEDFARSWLFTSSLTNFTVLAMPAVAVVLVAIDNDVPGGVRAGRRGPGRLRRRGLGRGAHRPQRELRPPRRGADGRAARWTASVARRRPTDRDFEEAAAGFRNDLRTSWKTLGTKVTLAVVGTYVTTG